MTLQTQAYITTNLGVQGRISRESPIPQTSPFIAEDDANDIQIQVGAFVFDGTGANQIKPTALAGVEPKGVAIVDSLQINVTGSTSMNVIEGMNVKVLRRGACFLKAPSTTPTLHDNVLVDPLTGDIKTNSATSLSASAGSLDFDTVATYDVWELLEDEDITLNVDGADVVVTGLTFDGVTDLAGVATVLDTAFDGYASCEVNDATTGLIFTSEATGLTSSVTYVGGDLGTVLGASTEGNVTAVVGTNAYNDTGWDVSIANTLGQTIEIERL